MVSRVVAIATLLRMKADPGQGIALQITFGSRKCSSLKGSNRVVLEETLPTAKLQIAGLPGLGP